MKVYELIEDFEVWLCDNIHIEKQNKLCEVILLWLVWKPVFRVFDLFWFLEVRLLCYLYGCEIRGGHGGFNLPDEAYAYWCKRCNAGESNYEGETPYHLIRDGIIKKRRR